ncbi:MAG: hypothetical protein IPM07_03965 [Anaerolineales bacterium]|nr:hypothetical protein [Anaerolineales bacterium]
MKTTSTTPVKHSTNGAAPKVKTVATAEPGTELRLALAAQTLPAPERPPGAPPPVKQQQRVDYYRMVATVRRQLDSVRALEPAMATLLAERGVTPAYLTGLEAQLEVARLALDVRQGAMKAEQDAIDAMERGRVTVQDALGTLRLVARTVVAEGADGDLTQLHLNDPLPRSTDLLIVQARAAFEGAQAEPYASLLATAAYSPAAVETALNALTVLEQLILARGLTHRAAMQATEARNRAVRDLRRAVRPLRAQMRAVLRRHPEFVAPYGF